MSTLDDFLDDVERFDDLVFIWNQQELARARAFRHHGAARPPLRFTNLENISMSNEERTRDEVLAAMQAHTKALIVATEALAVLVSRARVDAASGQTPVEIAAAPHNLAPPSQEAPKRGRKPKQEEPPAPPPAALPDIKPVVPTKGLGDLRAALQECIQLHGMAKAKERLAPYAKISEVPDDQIVETIERLKAD